jgi:hypothetical protein
MDMINMPTTRLLTTSKKGLMYTLDVFIAIIILVIGLSVLYFTFWHGSKSIYLTAQLSEDIVGVLASANTDDLCINVGTAGCTCPNYSNLTLLVCNENIVAPHASILSVMSEAISRGTVDGTVIRNTISEIFVTKNVIDEKRFGFSILYLNGAPPPYELYNTECASGGC